MAASADFASVNQAAAFKYVAHSSRHMDNFTTPLHAVFDATPIDAVLCVPGRHVWLSPLATMPPPELRCLCGKHRIDQYGQAVAGEGQLLGAVIAIGH